MDLKEITKMQKKFDEEHGWDWEDPTDEGFVERLKYITIALSGEVGEFANIVKKALRNKFPEGSMPDLEKIEKLKGELTDVFIYTIEAARILRVDLGEAYLKKMRELEVRFKDVKK